MYDHFSAKLRGFASSAILYSSEFPALSGSRLRKILNLANISCPQSLDKLGHDAGGAGNGTCFD